MALSGLSMSDMDEVKKNWGWVLLLSIALFILGLLAISMTFTATLATIFALGAFLLVAGVFEISNAFSHDRHGGGWMHLFTGVLDLVTGGLLIAFPAAGAAAVTLVLAVFFLVGGLMRFFSALMLSLPGKGWAMFSGAIDFALGILLLASWPVSALWFLGLVVGIAFIFRGIWWGAFAIAARSPAGRPAARTGPL